MGVENPGSMKDFTESAGLDISSEEATKLYTSALKAYRIDVLASADAGVVSSGIYE